MAKVVMCTRCWKPSNDPSHKGFWAHEVEPPCVVCKKRRNARTHRAGAYKSHEYKPK